MAHLYHCHRRCEARCVARQRQLVAAALDRPRQNFIDAGRCQLQRLFIIHAGKQPRQEKSRKKIAEPVRRIVDEPVLGQQRMPGDRRYRQREQSLKEGIVLAADDLDRLEALARI